MTNCFIKELITKFKNDDNIIKLKTDIDINTDNIINILCSMYNLIPNDLIYLNDLNFYVSYKIAYYYRDYLFNGSADYKQTKDLKFLGIDLIIYDDIPDNEMFITTKNNINFSDKLYKCIIGNDIIKIKSVDYVFSEYIFYLIKKV